jgi:hypothetical protein
MAVVSLMLWMLKAREAPSGSFFGFLCAVGAAVMAAQTYHTYRNGYIYRGVAQRVSRKANPRRFKFWLGVQISFVLFLAAFSVYGFLT